MLLKISLVLLIINFANAADECDIEKCPKPLKHLEEFGCKAIQEEGKCCPRYECPDFSKLNPDKCHLYGQEYEPGDALPRNISGMTCTQSCICSRSGDKPAKFICAQESCGFFQSQNCVNVYGSLNECCSTASICEAEQKKSLATCSVNNKLYYEGEKIYPESDPCYVCLCQKNFDNSSIADNKHCQKVNCGIQLHSFSYIQKGCIPIYLKDKACCPISWKCPKKVNLPAQTEETDKKDTVFVVTPSQTQNYEVSEIVTESTTEVPKIDVTTPASKEEISSTESSSISDNTEVPAKLEISESTTENKILETSSAAPIAKIEEEVAEPTKENVPISEDVPSIEAKSDKIEESTSSDSKTEDIQVITTESLITLSEIQKEISKEQTEPTVEIKTEQPAQTTEIPAIKADETSETSNDVAETENFFIAQPELSAKSSDDSEVKALDKEPLAEEKSIEEKVVEEKPVKEIEPVTNAPEVQTEASTEPEVEEKATTQNVEEENEKETTTLKTPESSTSESKPVEATTKQPKEETTLDPNENEQTSFEGHTEHVSISISVQTGEDSPKKIDKRSINNLPYILRRLVREISTHGQEQCVFGSQVLSVGDKIDDPDDCLNCSCEIAPIAYCVRKEGCY